MSPMHPVAPNPITEIATALFPKGIAVRISPCVRGGAAVCGHTRTHARKAETRHPQSPCNSNGRWCKLWQRMWDLCPDALKCPGPRVPSGKIKFDIPRATPQSHENEFFGPRLRVEAECRLQAVARSKFEDRLVERASAARCASLCCEMVGPFKMHSCGNHFALVRAPR